MSRRVLLVSVTLVALFCSVAVAEEKKDYLTPYKQDLAYQFYVAGAASAIILESPESKNDLIEMKQNCYADIKKVLDGIHEYEEWAMEFPDTWGRLPIGLLWGHSISMGGYEECVAASTPSRVESVRPFKGQYCLSRIPVSNFTNSLIDRDGPKPEERISYLRAPINIFELGICVPNTCSAETTDEILKKAFKDFYDFNYESDTLVTERYCKMDEPIELRGIDIFAIIFFSAIVFIMIISSIYDYHMTKSKQPKKPLFIAFSVLTNAPKIFTVRPVNNPNVIHCLNGIRCFSMMWVVFGHGYMTFYDLPHINKNRFYTWVETPYSMLVQNGSLCVDTFFFMSGLLMCWGAFREMEKTKGKLNIGMMYFHRYIRLTPVVAVVILYIMSLYKYSGAGPMWMKLGTQDDRCSDTWWATLLYVQNYVFPYKICISQSWYLAVDTQLYVLSPLFLIPLWKWGKKAVGPIVIFMILCLGCTFATFMYNDFTLFRVQDTHVDLRQRLTYYPTHTRIATWLIGVLFGYYLFTKNRGKQIPLAKKWVITGWILALGIMLTDLWGPYWRIRPENPNSPIIEGAFFEPLSRTAWALSMGWIVWACYNGHGGLINDFLSWGFFTGFSRLTYCMYVIHRIVQLVNAARLQTDTHFSNYDALLRWWHDFGITLTASIFATLAFEAPILGIEKAIFGHGDSKPAPKKVQATTAVPSTIETTKIDEETKPTA